MCIKTFVKCATLATFEQRRKRRTRKMKTMDIFPTRIALVVALALAGRSMTAATTNAPNEDFSPRLATLTRELKTGNRDALANFWKEIDGKSPLIEFVERDHQRRRLPFLWGADDNTP